MKRKYTIIVLFLVQMIAAFEMSGILSIGAYIIEGFGADGSMVMYLSIGAYAIGFLSPFCGNYADKYGRKKFIIISLALFILGSFFVVYSKSLISFIISRALTGLFVYSASPTILSYLGDVFPYENRGKIFGIIRTAFALGIVLSPVYTTRITLNFGLDMLYKLYMVYGFIILIAMLFVPEVKAKGEAESIKLNDIKVIFKDKVAVNFMIIQCLITFAGTCVFGYLSVHIINVLGNNIVESGYAYTFGGIGTLVASIASAILLDKSDAFIYAKIVFIGVAIVVLPLSFVKIPLLYVSMFMFSLFLDSAWPVFQLLSSEVVPQRKSTFMSILAGLISITNLSVVFFGRYLYNVGGFRLTNIIGSIMMVISSIIIILTIKNHKQRFSN